MIIPDDMQRFLNERYHNSQSQPSSEDMQVGATLLQQSCNNNNNDDNDDDDDDNDDDGNNNNNKSNLCSAIRH